MRAVRYTVDLVATTAAWASLALLLYLLPHGVLVLALQRWRPAGAWAFDEMMKIARARDDVWIATRREIAEFTLSAPSEWFV